MKNNNPALSFFDRIAVRYAERARREDSMYVHRAEIALDALNLHGKVLDLGAGSGVLYDLIRNRGVDVSYTAVDASETMIAQSEIPKDLVVVTDISSLPDLGRFDIIFALGLTTYLKEETMERLPKWLLTSLNPGGQAVITYTHEASWQWWMRSLLSRLPLFSKNTSLGSGLNLYASRPRKETYKGFELIRLIGFHHFLKARRSKSYTDLDVSPFYSDFLLHYKKS